MSHLMKILRLQKEKEPILVPMKAVQKFLQSAQNVQEGKPMQSER